MSTQIDMVELLKDFIFQDDVTAVIISYLESWDFCDQTCWPKNWSNEDIY